MADVQLRESQNNRLYDKIRKLLGSLDSKEIRGVILTHRQADPDALCAAGALKLIVESMISKSKIDILVGVPQGASVLGKQVSSSLEIGFSEKVDEKTFADSQFLIVVDTGDPKLLEPYKKNFEQSLAKKFLIDHHSSSLSPDSWQGIDDRVVIPSSTSTCEILALGFPSELITTKIANILLPGLLFDSQHLGIATKRTLEAAMILIDAGAEISRSKSLLHHNPDRSEILGKLKAAQRLRFEEAAGRVIARSEISSFHAAVARMLVEIGADVGIAYGDNNGEARLSVRSSQSFFRQTGIDLSEEIKKVATHFEIVGGGHTTAASASGKVDAEIVADYLVQRIKGTLLQK
jgi:nanoRNase/pAp phosphatase (c-di-AMP/oligoRNAs hydrolase)